MTKWKKQKMWNPQPKDEIEGKLRNIRKDVKIGDYNYNIYLIETNDSIISVSGCAVIDKTFEDMQISVGELVKIKFIGMKKPESEGKKEYKNYEVFVGSIDKKD